MIIFILATVILFLCAGFVYYTNKRGLPKALIAAALANMGERFGFYIMMSVLSLFLASKFGLPDTTTGWIYSIFYASIYVLALVGGVIADRTKNYKGTILAGLVMMTIGYLMISIPTPTPVPNLAISLAITCFGLFVIAFGNGLFKGNLQAVVGQMFDTKEFSHKRDVGFQIFYMFINIGGFFAPFIAIGVRNWWLTKNQFVYNSSLPELCHRFLDDTISPEATERLTALATTVSKAGAPENLEVFVKDYLDVFNTGFHYSFGAAIVAMLISLVVFIINRNSLPDPNKKSKPGEVTSKEEITMNVKEIKQRIYALLAVFAVVIFFWFSFHQNGLTLSFFARDYVDLSMINIDLGFTQIVGAEIFQSVNPFFVVFLTPIIIAIFGWLSAKGIEPSTPRKIGIGMGIAALAYVVMTVFSLALPSVSEVEAIGGLDNAARITPMLLIGTYFILTIAELFISPLGLSFVSKVAPPHLQGLMQGAWLATTAVGNILVALGAIMYVSMPLWLTWAVFVVVCTASMGMMLGMVKWLERVTGEAK